MKFEQILELVKAVSDSKVTTFKFEEGETKILLRTGEEKIVTSPELQSSMTGVQTEQLNEEAVPVKENVSDGNVVACPLVGTFYSSPSEEAGPFVQVGDKVKVGQTLAIVEAMKLMNEIESEFEGEVVEILAMNEQSVEYGQSLFVIK